MSVAPSVNLAVAMKHNPGFLALVTEVRKNVRECTTADVRARQERGEPFHFVDVREDSEFEVDRAAGARHLGRGVLERDIETAIPDRGATIILYCGGGFRSALAADNLQKMGYRNVLSMDGGIRDWRQKGYPLTKG